MRSLLFAGLLLVGADEALLSDPDIKKFFQQLLADGGDGWFQHERGGFVIAGPDGKYQGRLWPFNPNVRRATFTGRIPAGTVAIAHTHPRTAPQPSSHDATVAKRLSMPVFVITPRSIVVVTPDGSVERIVTGWWAR